MAHTTTTPETITTLSTLIEGWKAEMHGAERDALWAIFGGDHKRLVAAWNRGHQPTLNLVGYYENEIRLLTAMGANLEHRITEAGLDLKALLRGEYAQVTA